MGFIERLLATQQGKRDQKKGVIVPDVNADTGYVSGFLSSQQSEMNMLVSKNYEMLNRSIAKPYEEFETAFNMLMETQKTVDLDNEILRRRKERDNRKMREDIISRLDYLESKINSEIGIYASKADHIVARVNRVIGFYFQGAGLAPASGNGGRFLMASDEYEGHFMDFHDKLVSYREYKEGIES